MRKILFSVFTFLILILVPVSGQDCNIYYPHQKGVVREMTSYDKKDSSTGKVRQEILDVQTSGNDVNLFVLNSMYDKDGNILGEHEIEIGCSQGVFKIDMSEYVSEMLEAYQTMEVELEGDDLSFPGKMKAGDDLPEGKINIKVINNGMPLMNMDVSITNRKVEAIEEITTPVGSFQCYKITYVTVSKTRIMTITTKGVEWIAEDVGVVRSESFNKKGKSTGYSLLTYFE